MSKTNSQRKGSIFTKKQKGSIATAFALISVACLMFAYAAPGDVSLGGATNTFSGDVVSTGTVTATAINGSLTYNVGSYSYLIQANDPVVGNYSARLPNGTLSFTSTDATVVFNSTVANNVNIVVLGGLFQLSTPIHINLKHNLTLTTASNAVLNMTNINRVMMQIWNSTNVKVSGFLFDHGETSTTASDFGIQALNTTDLEITKNRLTRQGNYAVAIGVDVETGASNDVPCYNVTVADNKIFDSPKDGIHVRGGDNIKITENTIDNLGDDGIAVFGWDTNKLSNVIIENNIVNESTLANGIKIGAADWNTGQTVSGVVLSDITVKNNQISNIQVDGIQFVTPNTVYTSGVTVSSNVIVQSNTLSDVTANGLGTLTLYPVYWQVQWKDNVFTDVNVGVYAGHLVNSSVSGNQITGTLYGLVIDNSVANHVEDNIITDTTGQHGMLIRNASSYNTIQDNQITNVGMDGLDIIDATTIGNHFKGNTIINASRYSYNVEAGSNSVFSENTFSKTGYDAGTNTKFENNFVVDQFQSDSDIVFNDSAESGNTNGWTGSSVSAGGSLTVDAGTKYAGSNSFKSACAAAADYAQPYKTLAATNPTIYLHYWLYFSALPPANGNLVVFGDIRDTGGNNIFKLGLVNASGTIKWCLFNGWSQLVLSTTPVITVNTWYSIEQKVTANNDPSDGSWVWINGVLVLSSTGTANQYQPGAVYVGANAPHYAINVYTDNVVVSRSFIIPR